MKSKIMAMAFIVLFVAACSDAGDPQPSDKGNAVADTVSKENPFTLPPAPKRVVAQQELAQGKTLFLKNCAECHGGNAQGNPTWREKGENGKYPPPPLNGEGHAWHHPVMVLQEYIKSGSIEKGGSMEAFADKLSDSDVNDIIAWFQSKWPDEQYDSWYWRDKESRKKTES